MNRRFTINERDDESLDTRSSESALLRSASLDKSDIRYFLALFTFAVVSTVFGVSYSSVAFFDTPNYEAQSWGRPQAIRADEWNRATPTMLGANTSNFEAEFRPSLSAQPESDSIQKARRWIAEPDVQIISYLLDDRAVSYMLMRPIYLTLIGVFLLGRLLGLKQSTSALFTLLVVTAPPTVWWSFLPLEYVGPLTCGAGMILLIGRSRRRSYLLAPGHQPENLPFCAPERAEDDESGEDKRQKYVAFLSLFSTPRQKTSAMIVGSGAIGIWMGAGLGGYQIWGYPLAFLVWLIITNHVANIPRTRRILGCAPNYSAVALVSAFTGFTVAQLVRLWSERQQLSVLLETVYPGQRRTSGQDLRGLIPFSDLLSGVLPWVGEEGLKTLNSSEWAVGFLSLLVVFVISVVLVEEVHLRDALPAISVLVILVVIVLPLPGSIYQLPILNLFPTYRLAQILYLMLILSVMPIFSTFRGISRQGGAKMVLGSWLLFLMIGYKPVLESFTSQSIYGMKLFWFLVLFFMSILGLLVWIRTRTSGLALLALISAVTGLFVNPVALGFGALRDSDIARQLREEYGVTSSADERWATDDWYLDSLVAANGLPMVSGQQSTGPNRDAYALIDPDGDYEGEWNRGASSVKFEWASPGEDPLVFAPTLDSIVIRLDPCSRTAQELSISFLMSTRPLPEAGCLQEVLSFYWWHADRWIYSRGVSVG